VVTQLTSPIIEKLKAKQKELGISDIAFAKQIGISRPLWALVKTGKRGPGMKFIKAVMSTFPELSLDVMNYMANDNKSK